MKVSGARYTIMIMVYTAAPELLFSFTILGSVSEPCPAP